MQLLILIGAEMFPDQNRKRRGKGSPDASASRPIAMPPEHLALAGPMRSFSSPRSTLRHPFSSYLVLPRAQAPPGLNF